MLLWRIIRARKHLVTGVLCGALCALVLPATITPLTRAILSWDVGCAVLLASAAVMFSFETKAGMARHAAAQQEGEWSVFWLVVGSVVASFGAIIGQFSAIKDMPRDVRSGHVALVAITLLVSWLMTHTVFAMRYAHEYYTTAPGTDTPDGGLDFPGERAPDYWDFFYFALVLGMTFQVSDVQITSPVLRRLATAQGLLGFLFNTVIVALSVNIGASML
jgi:uncharacterized membrane protein